jgi:hypothetical protein
MIKAFIYDNVRTKKGYWIVKGSVKEEIKFEGQIGYLHYGYFKAVLYPNGKVKQFMECKKEYKKYVQEFLDIVEHNFILEYENSKEKGVLDEI